jgi:sugar (pentulose or hexulose) kinase
VKASNGQALYLGIDVGTSGVRAMAIDEAGTIAGQAVRPLPAPLAGEGGVRQQEAELWWRAVREAVIALAAATGPGRIVALAVDGTSGTLLLADAEGRPVAAAGMYNDASAAHLAPRIGASAPAESGAHGATSPLARLLVLQAQHPNARQALHQADWVAARFHGQRGLSDENNALKLGYDPVARRWPDWLDALAVRRELLPEVRAPGTGYGTVLPDVAAKLGLHPGCRVVAGTTDGCASFLATGAGEVGDAVSALGSTLTIKLLSERPIFAPAYGIYSHRLGDRWLAGGASNSGGRALLRFFAAERIAELTPLLRPDRPAGGRDWHPLPERGERFPVADPALTFDPSPRPAEDAVFFQALLEGIAAVEAKGYRLLTELGGPRLRSVRTVGGGGAANPGWTAIRAGLLQVPMLAPASLEAAYGTALLARAGGRGSS